MRKSKTHSWICLIIAALFLILGFIGWLIPPGYILISPRATILFAQLFVLLAINFSIIRLISGKEGEK